MPVDSSRLVELTSLRKAAAGRRGPVPKKRILVVNCYLPEVREPVRLKHEVPNTLAPVLLGGAFSPTNCEIRLYNEVSSGFLELFAPDLVGWPDLVVLTGLIASFDRMKHLTAYLRTANPRIIIVAGGQAIRAFPRYSRRLFDYVCLGDVEQVQEVIREALGAEYGVDEIQPRYDLADWIGPIGYAESSRNCNFKCDFCSLTGEGGRYASRIWALCAGSWRPSDAAGSCSSSTISSMVRTGASFSNAWPCCGSCGPRAGWAPGAPSAPIRSCGTRRTSRSPGRPAVCRCSSVSSPSTTRGFAASTRTTTTAYSQLDLISRCIEAGILFQYGIVFDPTERRIADLDRELRLICARPGDPAAQFHFPGDPFPGHALLPRPAGEGPDPAQYEDARPGRIDPVPALPGWRRRGRVLHPEGEVFPRLPAGDPGASGAVPLALPWKPQPAPGRPVHLQRPQPVFAEHDVEPGQPAGPQTRSYARQHHRPPGLRLQSAPPVASEFQRYFEPTAITTPTGDLHPEILDDVMDVRYSLPKAAAQ